MVSRLPFSQMPRPAEQPSSHTRVLPPATDTGEGGALSFPSLHVFFLTVRQQTDPVLLARCGRLNGASPQRYQTFNVSLRGKAFVGVTNLSILGWRY